MRRRQEKRCLDTNILIQHFKSWKPPEAKREKDAGAWAETLIEAYSTRIILSPTVVEFLCNVHNKDELRLREAYLDAFVVKDEEKTIPEDWREARRIAKHPGFQSKERDLGDCLIMAIAKRLGLDVQTEDKGLIRQHGRTRQQRP